MYRRDSKIKTAVYYVGWLIIIAGTIAGLTVGGQFESWVWGFSVILSNLFFGLMLLGLSEIMEYQEEQLKHLNNIEDLARQNDQYRKEA